MAFASIPVADVQPPDAFLARGRFADWDHPRLQAVAWEVAGGVGSPRERAVRLFRFVRDEVLFAFGPWNVPASETLARREGGCSNKSNLLVGLLRAAGVPAAYGVLRVNAREYFGNLTPESFKPLGSTSSTHVYAAAFLGGRWLKCDASTDAAIAAKTAHFCRQTQLVEWDGTRDALDALDPEHVYGDLGLRAGIDDLLEKPPVNATPALVALLNRYVRFIRSNSPFPSAEALLQAYFAGASPAAE